MQHSGSNLFLQLAMLNLQCVNIEPSKVDQVTHCLHLAGLYRSQMEGCK